ncbi:MAG TPA: hypothetical protein VGV64_05435 [Thermoplasmata archaeon]|nr:hypothetical protein [Thermoplasmata archaeon]
MAPATPASGPNTLPPSPWIPSGPPMPPRHPLFTPHLWPALVLWGRVLGLVLIFIGTIVAVAGASVPGSCITSPSSCGSNFIGQAWSSILAGKLLWVIGLFFLAGASGIRLQGGLFPASSASPEDSTIAAQKLRGNVLIVVICILLMALLLLTINTAPPLTTGIP